MYGVIQICLKSLLLERYGEGTWEQICKKAGMEDKFISFDQYDDDVTYRLVTAAASHIGTSTDAVYEMFGVFWIAWTMRIGYDKLIRTLGKDLAEFIGNLDFLHTVYLKTMYPLMEEPSFQADVRPDGSLTLHYFSVRKGLDGIVSGIIKAVSRIIFRERIEMDVIEFREEHHRGVRKDHWVFHVRFLATNLSPMAQDGNISQEELMSILTDDGGSNEELALFESTGPVPDETTSHHRRRNDNSNGDDNEARGFVAQIPDRLGIGAATFCRALPYHVAFDGRLVVRHSGVKLQQFCPGIAAEGALFGDFLLVRHPHIAPSVEALRAFKSSVFIVDIRQEAMAREFADKPPISLRGQMVWVEAEQTMIFLCSPRLTSLDDLTDRGLHFSDLALHDVTRDLLLFNQQRMAEVELSRQLEQKKEEMRLLMRDLSAEKRRTDALLYSMLPREVANELRDGRDVTAGEFPRVTILFSDIVHFTDMCSQVHPIEIVHLLNAMYTRFDQLTSVCGVYKVETIGDAYMVVGGVPKQTEAHAEKVASFGLGQLKASQGVLSPINGQPIQIRVGIHSGPVVAGVVGRKMPRYCLFGDTVNTASRMESTGVPGKVHTSEAVMRAIREKEKDQFNFASRGDIEVKGKGKMRTYFLYDQTREGKANHSAAGTSQGSPLNGHRGDVTPASPAGGSAAAAAAARDRAAPGPPPSSPAAARPSGARTDPPDSEGGQPPSRSKICSIL